MTAASNMHARSAVVLQLQLPQAVTFLGPCSRKTTPYAVRQTPYHMKTASGLPKRCLVGFQLQSSHLAKRSLLCMAQEGDTEVHHVMCATKRLPKTSFALTRDGTWILSSKQQTKYSTDLPEALERALDEADSHQGLDYVTYTAAPEGSGEDEHGNEAWFVRYHDGYCCWGDDLSKSLRKVLKENEKNVRTVHLGPGGAWYVGMQPGVENLHFKLPVGMPNAVRQACSTCGGVSAVAMGPEGEWFVRSARSTAWMHGLHPSLVRFMDADRFNLCNSKRSCASASERSER